MDIQRYIRYALSLVLTAAFLLHSGSVLRIPLLDSLENQAYDARIKLMPPDVQGRHAVIVNIDETSLETVGRWPWDRDVIATIVDNLFEHYDIKALGFDVVFAEADKDSAANLLQQMAKERLKDNSGFQREYAKALNSIQRDKRFAESLEDRKTVMGFIFGTETRKGLLPEPVAALDTVSADRFAFIKPEGYTANLENLQKSAYSGGFFDNPLIDDDGVYRRIPLLQQYDNQLHPSLALALVRSAIDSEELELIARSSTDRNEQILLEWLRIGDLAIPVDEHAAVLIPYYGTQRSFTYIPAIEVIDKAAEIENLRGKIVLFGTSAPGLLDLHTTPVEAAFPGVEIHANIIQGILDQTIMHRPGHMAGIEFILLFVLGVTLTFLLSSMPPVWCLISSTAAVLILTSINLAAWDRLQLVIPIISPVLLAILLYIFHITYGFFIEKRIKRQLARSFGQYVPPELVEEMSTKTGSIHLDGEVRDMSVLFSDVHHFTTISEGMDPEELTRMINGFLTPITEVIQQSRGTIDKYMGDAVMAFWGAPQEDPEHALHALTAATHMIQRINKLRPEFQANGWPEINIGIGINSGEMNVGNKGSKFRVDYTVVGDAVNLGSRLEALTRVYGVDIIVGENTRDAVPGFEFRELDRVKVKGRDKPVVIYEPLGPIDYIDDTLRKRLNQYNIALEHYRARRWNDAEQLLSSLSHDDPQRRIYRIYLDRIAHFHQQPPPDDWDGTFKFTTK